MQHKGVDTQKVKNSNLIKQILDPDINAAVCETAELIKQTKLGNY